METYYDESGNYICNAWSFMQCTNNKTHEPHLYQSQFFIYGPYVCSGIPAQPIFDQPVRVPVNKDMLSRYAQGGNYG